MSELRDQTAREPLSVERIAEHRRDVERHHTFSGRIVTELLDEIDRLRAGLVRSPLPGMTAKKLHYIADLLAREAQPTSAVVWLREWADVLDNGSPKDTEETPAQ